MRICVYAYTHVRICVYIYARTYIYPNPNPARDTARSATAFNQSSMTRVHRWISNYSR